MGKIFTTAVLFSTVMLLSSCSTFNKYATARFYEIYQSNGLSACNYKLKFSDCAEHRDFDVKISDDNNKIALAKFINHSRHVSYFGFTRDNYVEQTKPIREFLDWEENKVSQSQSKVMKRIAGNTAGYLFENSQVDYVFDFIHTRADVPMLVIHIAGRDSYYGFTVQEAKILLATLDSWYENVFSGKKIS